MPGSVSTRAKTPGSSRNALMSGAGGAVSPTCTTATLAGIFIGRGGAFSASGGNCSYSEYRYNDCDCPGRSRGDNPTDEQPAAANASVADTISERFIRLLEVKNE